MKCPKCGVEQAGTEQCAVCGVIFEKYRRYLERLDQRNQEISLSTPSSESSVWLRWTAVVLIVVAGLGSYLLWGGKEKPLAMPQPNVAMATAPPRNNSVVAVPEAFVGNDLKAQLEQKVPPANAIEKARNATVFLQTNWGLGSGFFIDEQCTIVTNRHVVRLGDRDVAAIEARIGGARAEADSIQFEIDHNKRVYEKIQNGEARLFDSSITQADLKQKIKEDEEKLARYRQEIETAVQELDNSRTSSTLTIILADGTKLDGSIDRVSDETDLAIVRPFGSVRCPAIPVGDAEGLHQGDQLFTVGSPMGIRHTVTSGIYSGSVKVGETTMLQTDAPINPGNSGGPLINEAGQVVGVNTLVLNNAQGIGFAIPVEQARQMLPATN